MGKFSDEPFLKPAVSIFLAGILLVLVFLLDASTPRGMSEMALYVLVILLLAQSKVPRIVLAGSFVCTLLIFVTIPLSAQA